VKYGFIKEHQKLFSIAVLCDVLNVSRSGYYDWLNHKPGTRTCTNRQLDLKIRTIHMENKQRYGAPRITHVLKTQNMPCSHTRVARRMQVMNLKGIAKKKFKVTTDSSHLNPVFPNVLNRDFTTTMLNQKWASDITYIYTEEGWMYLAVVIDLYSRAIIGWSMAKRMKKNLVCDALMMALFKRKFPKNIVVHSDRGSQYCSNKYRNIIKNYKLIGSMSRKGNCWDNAIAESFFHTLKVELIQENRYKTRETARQSIFQYIEGYYNQKRLHSALDYKAPIELEYAC
jgi:transposase InsO family protein